MSISFNIKDITDKVFSFSSIEELLAFSNREAEYWEIKKNEVTKENTNLHQYLNIGSSFSSFSSAITTYIGNNKEPSNQDLNDFLNRQKDKWLSNINTKWIQSENSINNNFTKCCKLSRNTADAFIQVVIKRSTPNNLNDFNNLQGCFIGFEYLLKSNSNITERYKNDFSSIEQLRSSIEDIRTNLIEKNLELTRKFNTWYKKIQKEHTSLINNKQNEIDGFTKNFRDKFSEFIHNKEENLEALEQTYESKLKLEKQQKSLFTPEL